jgi:hypothetical protein
MLRPNFKETMLNFSKPNVEFSLLQNVAFDLRTTDGSFADVKAVALEKRLGTRAYGEPISFTGRLHTLLSYSNKSSDYLVAGHAGTLYKFVESTLVNPVAVTDTVIDLTDALLFAAFGIIYINDDRIDYTGKTGNQLTGVTGITKNHAAGYRVIQRMWTPIKTGMTSDNHFVGDVMESYSGAISADSTVAPVHTGQWTSVSYDANSEYTTLTDNTKAWQADALIGRYAEVNTGDFPDLEYRIVENGATYIRVEGDIAGGITTTASVIAYTTTAVSCAIGDAVIDLTDASDFSATGGTINIEDDIITYTGKAGNQLTGVSGISIGHAAGAVCFTAEVTLASVSGFGQNGLVNIGGHSIYYNNKSGNKLLNLSSVPSAIASGAIAYNRQYKATAGKSYSIEFTTVTTRLVDTSAAWTEDAYVGYRVHLYAGKGTGQQRTVTSNKKDYLELDFPWEEEPDATTKYRLYQNSDQVLYMGNGTDSLQRFDGTAVTSIADSPLGNILMVYQSRLFIANGYNVNYSDVGDPEYFPPHFMITPPGDDVVTGLGEWNGNGIIFKERSIWKFNFSFNTATSAYDVELSQIPSNSGCISHRTIQKVENVLWYFDGRAVKYLGASPNQIGVIRTEDISFTIYQGLNKIRDSLKTSAVALYDGYNYLMFTAENEFSEYNDFGYDYDTGYPGWTTRRGNNASSVVLHKGKRYYGSSTIGQVYEMDVEDVYTDDGAPVDMIVETKDTDLGNPGIFKTFRSGVYGFENENSSVEYIIRVFTTKNTLTREGEWSIGFGLEAGATIGSGSTIGLGAFGASHQSPRRVVRKISIGHTGTRIQHSLRNRKNEKLTITDISTIWYPRSMRHFPNVLIS